MEALRSDIEELTELRQRAKRTRSQSGIDALLLEANQELAALETKLKKEEENSKPIETAAAEESIPEPTPVIQKSKIASPPPAPTPPKGGFVSINSFGFDAGGHNSPWVELYITLEDVGTIKEIKDAVSCEFKKDSFDLTVRGLKGKNYRLVKTNLENDIVVEDSKFIVKKNKIVIKLKKVKGDYSYDTWQNLTSKKNKEAKKKSKDDPTAGIMDMMKDMYDTGDDQMKKVIGEAMMKSKQGQGAEGGMPGM